MVELHLDYFGKKAIRKIELYGEEDTIVGDLIAQKIQWLNSKKTVDLGEERDEYQKRELKHFFDIVKGKTENDNSIAEAYNTLNIARSII